MLSTSSKVIGLFACALQLACASVTVTTPSSAKSGDPVTINYDASAAASGFSSSPVTVYISPKSNPGDRTTLASGKVLDSTIGAMTFFLPSSVNPGDYIVGFTNDFDAGTAAFSLVSSDTATTTPASAATTVAPTVAPTPTPPTDEQLNADVNARAIIGPITQPQQGSFNVGETVLIMWTLSKAGGKPCQITLMAKRTETLAIVYRELTTIVPNTKQFSWSLAKDIAPGNYAIRIGYPEVDSVNYSPTFSIVNAAVPSVTYNDSPSSTSKFSSPTGSNTKASGGEPASSACLMMASLFMLAAGNYLRQ